MSETKKLEQQCENAKTSKLKDACASLKIFASNLRVGKKVVEMKDEDELVQQLQSMQSNLKKIF